MAYDYKIEDRQQYIRVEISGKRTPGNELEDIAPIWSEATQTCRERKINKLLAVLKLTGTMSIIASYNVVKFADRIGWSRELRVALVDLGGVPDRNNLFTETVAVNRGYQLKVFRDEQEALTWLISDQQI
jgi:hypothetical protein